MTDEPDAQLLERWKTGDKDAGRLLYKRYFPSVRRYFHNKISDQVECDDLVQSTFEGLLKAIPRFRNDATLKTFVLAIAHNIFVTRVRGEKKIRTHLGRPCDDDSLSVADLARSPFSQVVEGQQARLLLSALRSLAIEVQALLELFYWEELTGPEIAEILEVPVGTVRSRLKAGRAKLEQAMEALASSPEELAGTLSNLDGWARKIREEIGR